LPTSFLAHKACGPLARPINLPEYHRACLRKSQPSRNHGHGADHLASSPAGRLILRYFFGAITDWLDVDPVRSPGVEKWAELRLAWLTLSVLRSASVTLAFMLALFVHRLPEGRASSGSPFQSRR